MYGSYGSYSSLSSIAQPLEIGQGSYLSGSSYSTSCAFPSWPRRSSLTESDSDSYQRASSYLSDDDLCPQDTPVFEDDVRSISSGSSSGSPVARVSEEELLEMQRERMALQRQAIEFLIAEKERRRQQASRKSQSQQQQRRGGSPSKKSPKSKLSSMTPIVEAGE